MFFEDFKLRLLHKKYVYLFKQVLKILIKFLIIFGYYWLTIFDFITM